MKSLRLMHITLLMMVGWVCVSCNSGGGGRGSTASAGNGAAPIPTVDAVRVISQKLKITVHLPGELQPYEAVAIYPKVTGFVKWIGVDRGSHVKGGELVARLEAPELVAQRAQAQAQLQSSEAQLLAAQANLAADESTYQKLKAAAVTPGVVAGNDLIVAEKAAQAGAAQVKASRDNVNAAKQALQSVTEIERYLQVAAPFDGVVTERNVHPGALVGPAGGTGASVPMVRIETLSRLRLVVPVPENYAAGIPEGAQVSFTVPAFPGQTFTGTVARISHSVDMKTRTMPVELEVSNPSGRLDPGTFSEVLWPVERPNPTLFVPSTALTTTLERVFIVRLHDGKAEWVDVKTGASSGGSIEVFGDLREGDMVALRGTDELRPETLVSPRLASAK